MYLLLITLAIIVCVLLVLMVLIQNPKGGGLSSNFSSSSQLMGVQKAGDFLEKGTWILAITLMALSLVINVSVKGGTEKSENPQLKEQIDKASKPVGSPASAPLSLPSTPQQVPAQPSTPAKK